ncbi:urea ABC transporter permease subunit UrtB [Thioalkalivibrio sp.]|uniref:urea ABC transporter permease subunit UrtB n=1 Tax=Thioalkalivibrio sp. TaxID=2093813 RepID=UPI0025F4DB0D|nr:urea ABC transporter permease subunit UrtB [Thioalkalivibrio sp.]
MAVWLLIAGGSLHAETQAFGLEMPAADLTAETITPAVPVIAQADPYTGDMIDPSLLGNDPEAAELEAAATEDELMEEAVYEGLEETSADVDLLIQRLPEGSFNDRRAVAEELAATGDPRVPVVLTALVEGRLLATGDDPPRILIRAETGRAGRDALTGEPVDADLIASGRRIPVHNPLRNALRNLIAVATIAAPDPERRAASLRRLMRDDVSPDMLTYLDERVELETDPRVTDLLLTVRALARLNVDDPEQRIESIALLRGSLLSEVRVRLEATATRDDDPEVRDAARDALDSIESRIRFFRFTENLFFGLSAGSVLLLAAIGLAITFGVMGVINMAHGELIMIGAYTTWFIQTLIPEALSTSILLAIPAAFVVAGIVGIAMERGVIQFLYGRPLETLLATFGISLILQQAVRTMFSPLNRPVASPEWLSGSLYVNPILSLTWSRIYILVFAIMVFVALLLVMKKTSLGLKVRAVAQNRPMARALGVRTGWVDALTFGLGAGIAGVAGVALSQLTNVGPNMGQAYIIDSFMVVVFGGVGNLWGTLVGAMGLGMMTKFLEPHTGAVLAKILVLIFIILFIQRRPRGLFPKKGRAAEA